MHRNFLNAVVLTSTSKLLISQANAVATPRQFVSLCAMPTQILEIEEPVEDQKGFVYEKAAIIEHIRKHGMGGEVACPHHGEAAGWQSECCIKCLPLLVLCCDQTTGLIHSNWCPFKSGGGVSVKSVGAVRLSTVFINRHQPSGEPEPPA